MCVGDGSGGVGDGSGGAGGREEGTLIIEVGQETCSICSINER